jgi:5'(3')-deoxyribonucleotidase
VIPVCPYAVKHFEMKHFLYKDRVKIITATWPETKEAKNGQIKKYFRVDDSQILNEYEKEKFTHDGILIDDNILNVYKHCKRNKKIGIVFDRNGKYGWSKFHNLSDDELIDEETMQYIKVAEDFDTITTILHNSNFC